MFERGPALLTPEEEDGGLENPEGKAVIVKEGLESPMDMETSLGPLAAATDPGFNYKVGQENQDKLVVAAGDEYLAVAVIDGMGGGQRGHEPAGHLAEAFQAEFNAGTFDFKEAQKDGHERMKSHDLDGKNDGACYAAVVIDKEGSMEIGRAGDVRVVVYDPDTGEKLLETRDETTANYMEDNFKEEVDELRSTEEGEKEYRKFQASVTNAVTGLNAGETRREIFQLPSGCRVLIGSDGLFDSIPTERVIELTQGKTPEEAMKILEEETRIMMTVEEEEGERKGKLKGKPDNRTIVIFDYEPA
jgi:serine/threonine protein phosphatase PrpC